MGTEENVKDGIQFFRIDGGTAINDLQPADKNDDDSCASDKDYEFNDDGINDSDNELNDNEEWVEDDDLEDSEDAYDLNDSIAAES